MNNENWVWDDHFEHKDDEYLCLEFTNKIIRCMIKMSSSSQLERVQLQLELEKVDSEASETSNPLILESISTKPYSRVGSIN